MLFTNACAVYGVYISGYCSHFYATDAKAQNQRDILDGVEFGGSWIPAIVQCWGPGELLNYEDSDAVFLSDGYPDEYNEVGASWQMPFVSWETVSWDTEE